jgi:predicted transcriptional regulator
VNRDKLAIIADILTAAHRNAKKTEIMHRANLSYKILLKYLNKVTAASLLSLDDNENRYVLTLKGKDFLTAYEEYSKTHRNVEKELQDIRTQRKVLESLCEKQTLNPKAERNKLKANAPTQ